jgi:hypothetical protein
MFAPHPQIFYYTWSPSGMKQLSPRINNYYPGNGDVGPACKRLWHPNASTEATLADTSTHGPNFKLPSDRPGIAT